MSDTVGAMENTEPTPLLTTGDFSAWLRKTYRRMLAAGDEPDTIVCHPSRRGEVMDIVAAMDCPLAVQGNAGVPRDTVHLIKVKGRKLAKPYRR